MRLPNRARGFTLLEVLIAVLIFSIGLLGVAGLMVLSVRTNHSAYLRTQASFLAQSMADRIRANVGSTLDYNAENYGTELAGNGSCPNDACAPGDLLKRDQEIWSQQLVTFLPNAEASIDCVGSQLGSAGQVGAAPFNGLCTMIIKWSEADLSKSEDSSQEKQTFAWVFQP